MEKWYGKYVIGLTGNIASGKSIVRKVLERLGGFGIDADQLAHRALLKGTHTYHQVIERFGKKILDAEENIDRKALGQLVFANAKALSDLEAIIHPFVSQTIEQLGKRTPRQIIIIEAIKLFESELITYCNTLWVVNAPYETRLSRLMTERGLSIAEAELRINAQPPQEEKIARADIVLQNDGSILELCQHIAAVWNHIDPAYRPHPNPKKLVPLEKNNYAEIERVQPPQADEFANWLTQQPQPAPLKNARTLQEMFWIKPFLSLRFNDKILAWIGWQIEDFIACVDEVWVSSSPLAGKALQLLTNQVEEEAQQINCEGILWFIPSHLKQNSWVWESSGYSALEIQALPAFYWQEVALPFLKNEKIMLAKQFFQQ